MSAADGPEAAQRSSERSMDRSVVERCRALIPGIITVVFRDRNTNAVAKSSLIFSKKFIRVTQQVQGTSVRSVDL